MKRLLMILLSCLLLLTGCKKEVPLPEEIPQMGLNKDTYKIFRMVENYEGLEAYVSALGESQAKPTVLHATDYKIDDFHGMALDVTLVNLQSPIYEKNIRLVRDNVSGEEYDDYFLLSQEQYEEDLTTKEGILSYLMYCYGTVMDEQMDALILAGGESRTNLSEERVALVNEALRFEGVVTLK